MKSFDEWWKTESLNTFDYPKEAAESGFEAGQQSKQAEVDELRKRVEDAMKCMEQNRPMRMDYKHAIKALEILKGENHES